MPPKYIYIIAQDDQLKPQTFERSGKLVHYFKNLLDEQKPTKIYANPNTNTNTSWQYLQPVSEFFSVPIISKYSADQYQPCASEILQAMSENSNNIILMSWQSPYIPNLIKVLNSKNVLDPWPENRFDVTVKITFNDSDSVSLKMKPQHLLKKDSLCVPGCYRQYQQTPCWIVRFLDIMKKIIDYIVLGTIVGTIVYLITGKKKKYVSVTGIS